MNIKVNLPGLAKTLAQKQDLSLRDAEGFLREFFDAIIQAVTDEGTVKVKGLGTFKLLEVQDRESVNIKTGERIIIPGHSRLAFTPEPSLRDLINKPFADFQTVVINEGTSIEEMEKVPAEDEETPLPEDAEEQAVEAETEPSVEPETAPEPQPLMAAEPEAEPSAEPETAPEPEPLMAAEPEPEPSAEPETAPEPEPVASVEAEADPEPPIAPPSGGGNNGLSLWKICASVLGVMLLCALFYFIGYNQSRPVPSPPKQEKQAEKVVPKEKPAPKVEYAQVPGGQYRIVGTRKTHVMKPGDYLSKIAIAEYGDKDFTPYIIVHNDFPDPDNVPVDMEIKLPELEKIE